MRNSKFCSLIIKLLILNFIIICVSDALSIYNVSTDMLSNTSVFIEWHTDKPAKGYVEWGTDDSYGNIAHGWDGNYEAWWHYVKLKNLRPSTTYHFRIHATDYLGNTYATPDYTFTTLSNETVANYIESNRTDGSNAKIYYVAPWGNDDNDGLSLETAWATWSYAIPKLDAGDALYIVNGNYYETGTIYVSNSGIPEAPIRILAYNGTPTLDGGDSMVRIKIDADANCIEIRDITIVSDITDSTYAVGISMGYRTDHSPHHIFIENVTVDSPEAGIIIAERRGSHHNFLINSSIKGGAYNTIYLWGDQYDSTTDESFDHILIYNNVITNNDEHNCINDAGNGTYLNIIGNIIDGCNDNGIYPNGARDQRYKSIVANRINNTKRGINLFSLSSGSGHLYIGNNVITNCSSYGVYKQTGKLLELYLIGNTLENIGSLDIYFGAKKSFIKNNRLKTLRFADNYYHIAQDILTPDFPENNEIRLMNLYSGQVVKWQYNDGRIFTIMGNGISYSSVLHTPNFSWVNVTCNVDGADPKFYPLEATLKPEIGFATVSVSDSSLTVDATDTFGRLLITSGNPDHTITINYYDNRVFRERENWAAITPEKSTLTIVGEGTWEIEPYNMSVIPSTGSVAISIETWDPSTDISFTSLTENGNNVTFKIWSLKPNTNYSVKKDGLTLNIFQSNDSGYISFSNSEWSGETTFTIEIATINESNNSVTGEILSTQITVNSLNFGVVEPRDSVYYYISDDGSIKSVAENVEAQDAKPFVEIVGGGVVWVSLGTNKSLPYDSIIYLDDDNIPNEDDSTMIVIKGNANNIGEILGESITTDRIYVFLKAVGGGDINMDVVLNTE